MENLEDLLAELDKANKHAENINARFNEIDRIYDTSENLACEVVSQIEAERETEGKAFANQSKEVKIKKIQEDCENAKKDAVEKGFKCISPKNAGGKK